MLGYAEISIIDISKNYLYPIKGKA